jgi:putative transposase
MCSSTVDAERISDEQFPQLERKAQLFEQLLADGTSVEYRQALRQQICHEFSIKERTLRSHLKRFKSEGLSAFLRKIRTDAGTFRRFDASLIPRATKLFYDNPYRSVEKILAYLRADPETKAASQNISASCLYHHMVEAGVEFKKTRKKNAGKVFHQFEAPQPNVLWQSDARHGISIPNPKDPRKTRMTYLYAWIDDYSRLILHAQYYFDEKLPRLEECLRQAVLKYGLPDKVYVDNGATYRAKQFYFILTEFEIRKIHHPPYHAWCKGKVEALMKSLKSFQSEAQIAGFKTIEELNSALAAWVDVEHNRKIHSSTGETPLARFLAGTERRKPRRVTDLEAFNNAFLFRAERQVDAYGNISFDTNLYLASEIPPKTKVTFRYNPFDLSRIYLFEDKRCVRTLAASTISRPVAMGIPDETKKPEHIVSKEAQNHFERLRQQQLKNIAASTCTNTYSNLKNKDNPND